MSKTVGKIRGMHDLSEAHHMLAMEAHEAWLRAERVCELLDVLNNHDGALAAEAQSRFSVALTLLIEEAPKLKASAETVAKSLSTRLAGAARRRA